ncbi:MAG: efflux RND transporter periplasmic adaptor subunit [Sulfitobacter sp.]
MKQLLKSAILLSISMVPAFAQDTPRPAKVFTLQEQTSEIVRRYPGIVLPSQEVELSFRVSGNLIELPIRGSMQVKAGDVIGQVDVRDFEAQVAQLQSQKDQADAQLSALKTGARPQEISALEAAVDAAQAQVDQAADKVERGRSLAERGTISRVTLEADEAALRVAEAQLRAEKESLAIGRAGGRPEEIDASEAAIRGIDAQIDVIKNNIADATLRAPFDGVIARRDVENFTNIQAGQSIALLQALSVIHVSFDVPAPDVTALAANGPDNIKNAVRLDALPGQLFSAETVEFSVQADTATQTYRGRVAVIVPEEALILPGMVGTVISSAAAPQSKLAVPLSAVAANTDSSPKVWIVDEAGVVSERSVVLGEVSGAFVNVSEGLAPGEVIVAAGVHALTPGMIIRPVSKIGG